MVNQLQFWVLVAGLISFVARYFYPDFPLDEAQILAAALFFLGLIGVYPQYRGAVGAVSILKSLAFWTLIAGLIGFILRYFYPDFPYSDAVILAVIVWVLGQIGIVPELRARGVLK